MHQHYKNILTAGLAADGRSAPILVTDFKTIKAVISMLASPDFAVRVYGSFNPSYGPVPDMDDVVSADNEYHELQFVNESNGVVYGPDNIFNADGTAGVLPLNVETTGENWIIFDISDYSAGNVEFAHADLYSNFN